MPYKLKKIREPEVIFREVQHFRQWWLWALIIPLCTLMIMLFSLLFLFQLLEPPLLIFTGIFMIGLGMGLPLLFLETNLRVEVREDGIYFRFFPFHPHFQKIELDNLKTWKVRKYSALREFGGYGIRFGSGGRAYNVSGNYGVQLNFKNGRRLLIGSKKPEQFVEAIWYLQETIEQEFF